MRLASARKSSLEEADCITQNVNLRNKYLKWGSSIFTACHCLRSNFLTKAILLLCNTTRFQKMWFYHQSKIEKNIIVRKLRIKDSAVETVFCIGIQVFWIADEKDKKRHLPTTKISFYHYLFYLVILSHKSQLRFVSMKRVFRIQYTNIIVQALA